MNCSKPLISIMVKDEQEKIIFTLLNYVKLGYNDFLIFDTGSTDETVITIDSFMKRQSKNAIIIRRKYEYPFDYSIGRNDCLMESKRLFPHRKFILMPDCEWYIMGVDKLESICKSKEKEKEDVYGIYVETDTMIFEHHRLFRSSGESFFYGPVHEQVISKSYGRFDKSVYFKYRPSKAGSDRSIARFETDVIRLEKHLSVKREPRFVFYLAQTLHNLKRYKEAISLYRERIEMEEECGNQERFVSCLRIGIIYQTVDNWKEALNCYIEASYICNTRIESLFRIANYYYTHNLQFCYRYAKKMCSIEKPEDGLFLEHHIYDTERWRILSLISNKILDRSNCVRAALKVLDVAPSCDMWNMLRHNPIDESNLVEYQRITNKVNILNLILYSDDKPEYLLMKNTLEIMLTAMNIRHYFYKFDNDIEKTTLIGNTLHIKGVETYISGILNKTLTAFDYFKDYNFDHIVRSNISTLVNFPILKLFIGNFDYTGPLLYSKPLIDHKAGITKENLSLYACRFVSGTCIILSKRTVRLLVMNRKLVESYNIIDDVAFGVFLNIYKDNLNIGPLNYKKTITENTVDIDFLSYRFKTDDRVKDAKTMQTISTLLIENKF